MDKQAPVQHNYFTPKECDCDKEGGCNICDGALTVCKVCGGAEGSLASECPGYRVHPDVLDAVYSGQIDFKGGLWTVRPGKKSRARIKFDDPEDD